MERLHASGGPPSWAAFGNDSELTLPYNPESMIHFPPIHPMARRLLFVLFLASPPAPAGEPDAVLAVDASRVISSFRPFQIFGNNVPAWTDPVPLRAKIQAAGNYLLRIPGGSWGDVYHWNSAGSFDEEGR